MAKIKEDIEDLHESSLDNSGDGEYILSEESGTFGTDEVSGSREENSRLVPLAQHFLDTGDSDSLVIPNSVTYKLIHVGSEEPDISMQNSPSHDTTYYVISNPGDVFGTQAVAPKKNLNTKISSVKVEPIQNKAPPPISKKRDDKRRATHNEVERRRRDKINSWIMKLAALVPNSGLPDSASKGGILAKACDYITDLTEKQKRLEKLEVENEKLVLEVLRLNQELSDLRKDNSSMRNQLADNCIVHNTKQKGQKP